MASSDSSSGNPARSALERLFDASAEVAAPAQVRAAPPDARPPRPPPQRLAHRHGSLNRAQQRQTPEIELLWIRHRRMQAPDILRQPVPDILPNGDDCHWDYPCRPKATVAIPEGMPPAGCVFYTNAGNKQQSHRFVPAAYWLMARWWMPSAGVRKMIGAHEAKFIQAMVLGALPYIRVSSKAALIPADALRAIFARYGDQKRYRVWLAERPAEGWEAAIPLNRRQARGDPACA